MEKVIFDTDIGDDIDDAVALRLVLKCGEIQVLGITTAYKNSMQRAKIAAAVARESGQTVPVYAGVDNPSVCWPERLSGETLGEDGKIRLSQYFDFMAEERVETLSAVDYILEVADKYPGEVTLLSLAPLCNLAAAYKKDPDRFNKLKRIVMMGGCFSYPFAEWNIRCDVESALTAFSSPVEKWAVGYDITQAASLNEEQTERILRIKDAQVLRKMFEAYLTNQKFSKPTMHDPLTVSSLVKDYITYDKRRVKIISEGKDRGKIFECDEGHEINVAVKADIGGFMEYLFATIGG